MVYSRSVIVEQARLWLGRKESDGSHKVIIDTYNSHKPLARGYKVKYTDAWCSTFVSAVAIKCGYTDIIPTECGCEKHIQLFKKIGRWVENDAYVPKAGDIIFYDWQDNGNGDCTGYADHVGIVEQVVGNTITVIEGNMNNCVGRRTLAVNGKYIRGYGVPAYDENVVVSTSFKVGDAVQLVSGATYYDGKSIPSWVMKSRLYIREIKGDRIVISTQKTGAVTGAIHKKYLKLL